MGKTKQKVQSRRSCSVPHCFNTKHTSPEKKFFASPHNIDRRNQWLLAMKRETMPSAKTTFFVCQDHFDVMARLNLQPALKKNVIPTRFQCQDGGNSTNKRQSIAEKLDRLLEVSPSPQDLSTACSTSHIASPEAHHASQADHNMIIYPGSQGASNLSHVEDIQLPPIDHPIDEQPPEKKEEKTADIELVEIPIKVEPEEFECEETTHHVIETEDEMYEKHGQLHSTFVIEIPIKVEPEEFECEETTHHVIETEDEMYEKHGQLHSTFVIEIPIKVEPEEFECEDTRHHVMETEDEMYEKHGQLHSTFVIEIPIKVEPEEFECEDTRHHVMETEDEMYEKHGQLHSTFVIKEENIQEMDEVLTQKHQVESVDNKQIQKNAGIHPLYDSLNIQPPLIKTSWNSKCMYRTCTGTSKQENPDLTFHRFPSTTGNEERCKQWIILSGVEEKVKNLTKVQLRGRYLCSRHFKPTSYYSHSSLRLVKNALPINYLDSDNSAWVKKRQ